MSAVHVFAGPSIPRARVRALLPRAIVHGPIRHRSTLELELAPGAVLAVIDGVFLQSPSIRHKELLHALEQGVEVWGAASMGALRAAELGPFGMRGVGVVQRLFAWGALERDDEVAVMHAGADAGHVPLSTALVSVRVLARRARRRGLITRAGEQLLVDAAATLPFPERQPQRIAQLARQAGADRIDCGTFERLARDPANDVKREDAELLLRTLAARALGSSPPSDACARRRHPRTRHLAQWVHEARTEEVDGERVRDADALAFCQAFAEDYPAWHRRLVLRAIAAADVAVPPAAARVEKLERMARAAACARGLLRPDGSPPPAALEAWLDPAERDLPATETALRLLVRSYRQPPDVTADTLALEALRGTSAFALAQHHVARAQRLNATVMRGDPRRTPDRIPAARLWAHFAERWGVSTDRVELALLDRGFASRRAFAERLRPQLPYAALGRVPAFGVDPELDPQVKLPLPF